VLVLLLVFNNVLVGEMLCACNCNGPREYGLEIEGTDVDVAHPCSRVNMLVHADIVLMKRNAICGIFEYDFLHECGGGTYLKLPRNMPDVGVVF